MSASTVFQCSRIQLRRPSASPESMRSSKVARAFVNSFASSSMRTSRRVSGFMVVSQSCSRLISPRPLKREISQLASFTPSFLSCASTSASSSSSRQYKRRAGLPLPCEGTSTLDRKSTRLNSSQTIISYAVFCLKKKMEDQHAITDLDALQTEDARFGPQAAAHAGFQAHGPAGAGRRRPPPPHRGFFFFLMNRGPPSHPPFPHQALFR